jgi:Na+/H+ antiporter NhaA
MVMATDTAFAVGVLALVGRRSSVRLRIFLLTLVIIDDIAAVSVIALFYSTNLQPIVLVVGLILLAVMAWLRSRGVEAPLVYLGLGIGVWLTAFEAGVHPTVAGVAMGLLTGAYAPRRTTLQQAIRETRAFRQQPSPALAAAAATRIVTALSPNDRLQHAIHPWSSYVIVPLFALANAGIDLSGDLVGRVLGSPLTIGIVLGLVVGKTVGIPAGAWLATRKRLGGSPLSVGWPQLIAASAVAGIGFTVSLLIADLSYASDLLDDAKLGILLASALAAVLSVAMFYGLSRLPADRLRRAEARAARPLSQHTPPHQPTPHHQRGPLDAPVTLIEYGDFECPRCGRAAPMIRELLERERGRVRFVFRHLPLPEIHPRAPLAAEAAEAAAAQGKFWEMHDKLFAHQDALLPRDLTNYAEELGLDVGRFEAHLRERAFARRVAEDVDTADDAGAVGTPTFFINDVLYRGPRHVDALEAAVERAAAMAEERNGVAADVPEDEATEPQ